MVRVLKPGGVLLNFDANWYRYLWDRGAEQTMPGTGRTCGLRRPGRDGGNGCVRHGGHRPAGTAVGPYAAGLGPGGAAGLGLQAAADTEIWRQVWIREERINNASTPMFLVEARKCPLPQ